MRIFMALDLQYEMKIYIIRANVSISEWYLTKMCKFRNGINALRWYVESWRKIARISLEKREKSEVYNKSIYKLYLWGYKFCYYNVLV